LIEHDVIENLRGTLHLVVLGVLLSKKCLFGADVATLNQEFLKFEHVVHQVFVLLQEFMFILCLLEFEKLVAEAQNGGLLVNLQFTDFFGSIHEFTHAFLNLLDF
jgi:hypothetical protein